MAKYLYSIDWPFGSICGNNLKEISAAVYKKFKYLIEFCPEVLNNSETQIYHNTRLNHILDTKYVQTNKFKGNGNVYTFFVHPVNEIKHIDMWDCTFKIKRMRI